MYCFTYSFNVHTLDASPFTCCISKLVISCNSQKLRSCSEILMVKRNIIFLNSHIALCCSLINFSPPPPGLFIQRLLLIFFPHWRNLVVFFWSKVTINYTIYSTFSFEYYSQFPLRKAVAIFNIAFCLVKGDVGARQN